MSKQSRNNPIRRVPKGEKAGRVWPDKKQLASSHPGMLNPDPRKKDKVHSVITALPVIMLLVGLIYWYANGKNQRMMPPIEAEAVSLVGVFDGVTKDGVASKEKYYLSLLQDGAPTSLRITSAQHEAFSDGARGSAIAVVAAPTVSGASTLWILSIAPAEGADNAAPRWQVQAEPLSQ